MLEKKITTESKSSLRRILRNVYNVEADSTFDDLLRKCNEVPYTREEMLEAANRTVSKLLNGNSNEQAND